MCKNYEIKMKLNTKNLVLMIMNTRTRTSRIFIKLFYKQKIIYRHKMLENGEFPSFTEMNEYQENGVNCFSSFDDNPELVRQILKLDKIAFDSKCSIKDSFYFSQRLF